MLVRLDFARAALRGSGGGEAFDNEIRALADAAGYGENGVALGPRYAPRMVEGFRRMIAARGPELRDAVFQLAHLARAAAAVRPSGAALEVLFAPAGRAEPATLQRALQPVFDGAGSAFAGADDAGLIVRYADGGGYRLTWRRLPMVLMLMEFGLGPFADDDARAAWDAAFAAAQTCAPNAAGLRTASNALSKALSGRLDQIARDRQSMQRFAALVAHLDARAVRENGRAYWRIDDAAVLDFWCDGCVGSGGLFRRFATAHRWFVALLVEISAGAARRGMDDHAIRLDDAQLREIGDRDVAPAGERAPALAALASPPCDGVKFLTKKEATELAAIDAVWRAAAPSLPLSMLRAIGFGADQSELVTAQQFGRDTGAIRARLRATPNRHAPVVERLRALARLLERLRLAAAFIHARAHGIDLADDIATRLGRAFSSFERKGFGEAEAEPQGAQALAFSEAIAPLAGLSALLETLLTALDGVDLAAVAAGDAARFADAFDALYAPPEGRDAP